MRTQIIVSSLFFLLSLPVVAADDDTPLQCRAIDDDLLRLACYDRWADRQAGLSMGSKPAKTSTATPAAPEKNSETPQVITQVLEKPFGEEDLPPGKRKDQTLEATELMVTVVDLKFSSLGKAQYYLSDGQIWEQADRAKARRYAVPFDAVITRAAMGSYMIQKSGTSIRTRIKRKK